MYTVTSAVVYSVSNSVMVTPAALLDWVVVTEVANVVGVVCGALDFEASLLFQV